MQIMGGFAFLSTYRTCYLLYAKKSTYAFYYVSSGAEIVFLYQISIVYNNFPVSNVKIKKKKKIEVQATWFYFHFFHNANKNKLVLSKEIK